VLILLSSKSPPSFVPFYFHFSYWPHGSSCSSQDGPLTFFYFSYLPLGLRYNITPGWDFFDNWHNSFIKSACVILFQVLYHLCSVLNSSVKDPDHVPWVSVVSQIGSALLSLASALNLYRWIIFTSSKIVIYITPRQWNHLKIIKIICLHKAYCFATKPIIDIFLVCLRYDNEKFRTI